MILQVGHSGPYKNVEAILCVLPIIQKRIGRPVELLKVGGPFTSVQLQLIERLGIGDRVRFLGAVDVSNLLAAYTKADLLLMPSLYEGFGLPALEAMACGTPVVVSNKGSLPEVVGEAGLYVEPTDFEGIADAVARVLTEPQLRAQMRARGLKQAANFSWERTARETLAVYREVFEEAS
jgi:glycosyltransferase involved in cell wall biosynthesis